MSVLVTLQIQADTEKFTDSMVSRASDFTRIAEMARAAGAVHHRFGIGDGFVMVTDEWRTEEDFERFFAQPELQAFIGEGGGDTSFKPDIVVAEAIDSPDMF
jgi:hypothetical protein